MYKFFPIFSILYLLEIERNLLVGKLSIDSREGIGATLNIRLVLGIEVNFRVSFSISFHPNSLSNNFRGVDNIVQDSLLNRRQRPRTRSGTGGLMVAVVRLSKNGTLPNDQNMLSRKLLLKLSDKLLVDLLNRLQQLVWHVQDDGLSGTAVDLLRSCDVNVSERGLELCRSHFKIEKLVGHGLLELIRFL